MSTPRFRDIPVDERRHSHVLQRPLAAPRGGIMLHYDDSSRANWALEWFADPRCTNGYTWLVLDDGRVVELADPGMRTPHAGSCRTPKANSVYYGVAAATNGWALATERQLASIVRVCAAVFHHHLWRCSSVAEIRARILGHDEQAVWTAAYTSRHELWGQLGRKVDPTGQRADGRPIIGVGDVARRVLDDIHCASRS
jgi:N-acetyl-anhydromuramyl-L-alanine amidase AmpD